MNDIKEVVSCRVRVLTFVDYYLPGYRYGGPPKTIANTVEALGDEFEFLVVTRDREFGACEPYAEVQINDWNTVGKAKVFYAGPSMLSFRGIRRLLNDTAYDVLYFNSFLSPRFTVLPGLIRWLGFSPWKPIIIAPRGEFSPGALATKPIKKKIYITAAKLLQIYRGVIWQASSNREVEDIESVMGPNSETIMVAPDLPYTGMPVFPKAHETHKNTRGQGFLQMVFLSRISPMKNLDFLLRLLGRVKAAFLLTIYGPVSDLEYWAECQEVIRSLPSHIAVHYAGEVTPDKVAFAFAQHDVFVFPTRGENFGHVVLESLSAGTALILSDQTPWHADAKGAVEVLSLDDPDAWVAAIDRWSRFTHEQLAEQRTAALNYVRDHLAADKSLELNRKLFRIAAEKT